MPLPIPIHYVDAEQNKRTKVVVDAKPSGYRPTPEYHPTMVAVKCVGCGGVGIVEFAGGFDLKKGDALMAGRPITGTCMKCGGEREFVPIKHILGEEASARARNEYRLAVAVERAAQMGHLVGPNSIILPVEKQEEYERRAAENRPS